MNIVAIYPQHNSTAALFVGGKCQRMLQEEKFSNIKNHTGFPTRALKALSEEFSFEKVDAFVFPSEELFDLCVPNEAEPMATGRSTSGWEATSQGPARGIYNWLEYHTGWKDFFFNIRDFILHKLVSPRSRTNTLAWLERHYGICPEKVSFLNHHLCHCMSPFMFYGLGELGRDLLLFSMDGAGDNQFAKIMVYRHATGTFEQIAASRFDSSIGLLYCEVTSFLGMRPTEHEYKVMGLAAYVSDFNDYRLLYEKLREIFTFSSETLEFGSQFNTNLSRYYLLKHARFSRFDHLAAAVQKVTEDLTMEWISAAVRKTGLATIACSGGVFLNVKMNQKIQEMDCLERVYFMPSCGDESNVLGAACEQMVRKKIRPPPMRTMFLGQCYTNADVEKFLQGRIGGEFEVIRHESIEREIARLLSEFKIVARFRGGCEWGARSLCNRGILGNASDLKTFYEVNDAIKMRDFWMPFAPTIQEEWAERYLRDWTRLKEKVLESSRYMITAFHSTPLAQQDLRAAIHQKDKTLRPQVVNAEANPELHALLKHYESFTGFGGIMNTSFNLHGYPMVGTLDQAWFTFTKSGLKYLALENFMIRKK